LNAGVKGHAYSSMRIHTKAYEDTYTYALKEGFKDVKRQFKDVKLVKLVSNTCA
jgi:hypothetical protein